MMVANGGYEKKHYMNESDPHLHNHYTYVIKMLKSLVISIKASKNCFRVLNRKSSFLYLLMTGSVMLLC